MLTAAQKSIYHHNTILQIAEDTIHEQLYVLKYEYKCSEI